MRRNSSTLCLALLLPLGAASACTRDEPAPSTPSPDATPQPKYTEALGQLPRTKVAPASATDDGPVAKTPEERRLAVKIASLKALQGELEAARAEVPAQEAELEKLVARLDAVKVKLGEPRVSAALKEAAEEIGKEPLAGQGPVALRLRLAELEQRSVPLLAREDIAEAESGPVKALKLELRRQQNATVPAATAARLAAGALTKLEELKRAVPVLEVEASK